MSGLLMEHPMYTYFILINFFTLILFGIDKQKAKKGAFRISEDMLLFLALIGGSIGAILGMKIFHHKIRKVKFWIGIPLIFVCQLGIIFKLNMF